MFRSANLSLPLTAEEVPVNVLPLIEWCDIPAGNVTITYKFFQGVVNHPAQYLEEQRSFWVESFRIAKYPVTNTQYQLFIEAHNGYSNPMWWDYSPYATKWRAQQAQPSEPYFRGDDHPRNIVSWYDAMAFCRWLAAETQLPITLPTEQQWQRAGQGDDGRIYPWENNFDTARCNGNNEIKKTTPVTRYPDGISPYGVYDLAGNVEEWCLTEYETGSNDDLSSDSMRVYRGGSFNLGQNGLRLDERGGADPDYEIGLVGFRVVCN